VLPFRKSGDDANNQDGIRPESIKVQLYADGKISGDAVTLNASNSWATTFNDLAENSQGNPIVYTVKEVDLIPGYQATIDDTNKANIVITNTHAPEMVDISGTKTWDDKDNQDGIRPERITVNLLVNGIKTDSKTITAADNWQYTFGELPKFSDGKAIAYVLMEEAVAGYDFSNKGFDITNTHIPDVKSVSITKKWSDKDNQFKSRPDKIQVQLYANGVAFGQPVDVTAKNNWQYTWNELPVKQAGQVVDYTMKEISQVPGYDVSIDASDKDHVVLTNTYTKKVMSQDTSQNLPKTSDTTNPYYLLVGLFLVVLSGIKLFYKKR
jgi:LPXTG-motif cell wall-anchored protein